jgi:beta-mannosidase
MAYRINGQKLFTKASWFPIENLYRSSATHEDYELDLRLYRAANFNLVTNFTVVEKPEFYDLCDELGILIVVELPFQQFGPMEALDKDSPRREPFLKESGLEVAQIVTAERNHPSVIQFSPLAEAQEKSGTWGFGNIKFDQDGYTAFEDEMKETISRLAPDVVFHPSLCDVGEQHFWEAGQAYLPTFYQFQFDAQAKFISEFGTLSTDNLDSIGNYLAPKEQWDPGRKTSMDWFNLPIDIRARSYWTDNMNAGLYGILWRAQNFVDKQPRTEAELVTSTQLYHAFLMQYEVESYRRKKYDPVAGIRQWAFKDVGPGTRGTMLDYYHQ